MSPINRSERQHKELLCRHWLAFRSGNFGAAGWEFILGKHLNAVRQVTLSESKPS